MLIRLPSTKPIPTTLMPFSQLCQRQMVRLLCSGTMGTISQSAQLVGRSPSTMTLCLCMWMKLIKALILFGLPSSFPMETGRSNPTMGTISQGAITVWLEERLLISPSFRRVTRTKNTLNGKSTTFYQLKRRLYQLERLLCNQIQENIWLYATYAELLTILIRLLSTKPTPGTLRRFSQLCQRQMVRLLWKEIMGTTLQNAHLVGRNPSTMTLCLSMWMNRTKALILFGLPSSFPMETGCSKPTVGTISQGAITVWQEERLLTLFLFNKGTRTKYMLNGRSITCLDSLIVFYHSLIYYYILVIFVFL